MVDKMVAGLATINLKTTNSVKIYPIKMISKGSFLPYLRAVPSAALSVHSMASPSVVQKDKELAA